MANVFISYKREDKERAALVAKGLEAARFSVFYDPEIGVGESWDERIERELDSARAVVVLWSPRSRDSRWVRNEALVGLSNSALCPALIEETAIPVSYLHIQAADLRDWDGAPDHPGWRALLASVDQCANRTTRRATPADSKKAETRFTPVMDDPAWQAVLAKPVTDLTAGEAYVHILVGALLADGAIHGREMSYLRAVQQQSSEPIRRHFDAYIQSARKAFKRDYIATVARACKMLPADMALTAYANAATMAFADHAVTGREIEYLNTIERIMGLSHERAVQILDVTRIQHLF